MDNTIFKFKENECSVCLFIYLFTSFLFLTTKKYRPMFQSNDNNIRFSGLKTGETHPCVCIHLKSVMPPIRPIWIPLEIEILHNWWMLCMHKPHTHIGFTHILTEFRCYTSFWGKNWMKLCWFLYCYRCRDWYTYVIYCAMLCIHVRLFFLSNCKKVKFRLWIFHFVEYEMNIYLSILAFKLFSYLTVSI